MNDLMTQSFLSYVDLKKQAQMDIEAEEIDLEKGGNCGQSKPANEQNLSVFFQEVAAIKSEMDDITNLLLDLQNLNEETKSTHSVKVLRGLRDQMESDTVAVLRKGKIIRARLEALDQSNVNNRRTPEFREGSSVDRTRTSVTGGLRIKLRDMMNHFNTLRAKILSDHKDDLKRTYYNVAGREPTEISMEKMVLEGRKVEELIEEKRDLGLQCKERHEAAMDIQRSLNRLHQVFLDMAVLVEKQVDQVDDIEQNVAVAGSFINGGTNSLFYANQMKKKKKKWVYWVWAVGMIILLVCFIAMLTT